MPANLRQSRLTELLGQEFLDRLDNLELVSRKILQGKMPGEQFLRRRGESIEFADHRAYVTGDDLRFIDWNTYARLGQLFLKLFLDRQDVTLHLLIDSSASVGAGKPDKLSMIRKLAVALAYVALGSGSRLTISLFADGITWQASNLRGRAQIHKVIEGLLSRSAEGSSDFEKTAGQVAACRSGCGVSIVLSDFLFKLGYQCGLQRLLNGRFDLCAIQVLSPQELDPPLTGDLRLIDIEDADAADVTMSPKLLRHYKQNLSAWCAELQTFCSRHEANYVRVNSSQPAERLVLDSLTKTGLLR